ncbi:MAG: RHS repeat domain-containing protein [Usitatibacter sp.]
MNYHSTTDAEHYNYFRDYDPAIGRYIESDPIGLRGGINRFLYVTSSPLRFIDRYGLAASCGDGPPDDECCKHTVTQHMLADQGIGGTVMCCRGRKVSCSETPNGPEPGRSLIKKCLLQHEDRHIQDVECSSNNTIDQSQFRSDVPQKVGECNAFRVELDCLNNAIGQCGNDGLCQNWMRENAEKKLGSANRRFQCGFTR